MTTARSGSVLYCEFLEVSLDLGISGGRPTASPWAREGGVVFRSFIAWLDNYMAGEEPSSLLKSLVGLLSFSVLLGAIVGNTAVKAGGLVVVMLSILFVILALVADRKRLKRHKEKNRRLVSRYCDVLKTRLEWSWRITRWDQVVKIDSNGDTVQTISVHAVAECDYLDFFTLTVGAGWAQPEKYRDRVRLKVRSTRVVGREGPHCDVTQTWTGDHKLEALVHLPSPVERGAEFQVTAEWKWPAKCRPLMKEGTGEDFCLTMLRDTQQVRYIVLLPARTKVAHWPVGFTEGENGYKLRRSKTKSGQIQVVFAVTELPAARRVGIRLEVR
jgi:hypothetical protein